MYPDVRVKLVLSFLGILGDLKASINGELDTILACRSSANSLVCRLEKAVLLRCGLMYVSPSVEYCQGLTPQRLPNFFFLWRSRLSVPSALDTLRANLNGAGGITNA